MPATHTEGIEHTIGYEDLPPTGESFEGQAVAVLGMGNGAMETADALGPYVNYVHLFAGRGPPGDLLGTEANPEPLIGKGVLPTVAEGGGKGKDQHTFVSWESRYVGNVRAINAGLLDAYLLKSLSGARFWTDFCTRGCY
jgi:hypothetical protein